MKKVFALIISGLVTIGVLAWLVHYLSTGTITITAKESDTITLQKTSGGKPFTRISTGSLSVSVKHGRYTATVKNGSKTSVQVIDFSSGHKTFRYSISLVEPLSAEPVADTNAQDLSVTPDELVYLDAASHTLYRVDSQNNLQQVSEQRFQVVRWANASFGVGQSNDGSLYTITGSSISPLRVPFSYSSDVVNFDVSPNKKIYISAGANVYAGSQTGGFKKIYTASSSKPSLAAGISGVAVSDSKYGANASDVSKPLLATISVTGKKSEKNVEAERMAWSPNGQYLAVVNQDSPVIYNAALRQAAVVPTASVVGQFEWLNDTSLFYASSYQLWAYNLPSQKTQLLATVSPLDSITGIYSESDGSYVYITTLNSTSLNYAIKRVGLKDQSVPSRIARLREVIPERGATYSIGLINFTSAPTTILVRPYSQTQAGNYIQQAQAQLQSQGVDTAQLRFQSGPAVSGD